MKISVECRVSLKELINYFLVMYFELVLLGGFEGRGDYLVKWVVYFN